MSEIKWPPQLLRVLRSHLQQIDDPQDPRTIPLATKSPDRSVLTFLTGVHDAAMQLSGVSEPVATCCRNLLLEMIEQCCALLFLSSKERRIINLAASQREKRLGVGRGGVKRRRSGEQDSASEEAAAGESGGAPCKCAAVLPLEYLLRLFVALPSLLVHYDKLGGSAMPPAFKQPLWDYVNALLDIMKDMHFIDESEYVPLR
uniref:MRG domain-containing protein n=1 Tax=Trypanosoma congolense (strain IL3000) TaxID=1068625 RepID=G0UIR1_TRYCI|nr:conserved hypothetical protein [Trypanosoma congolense IL3000]